MNTAYRPRLLGQQHTDTNPPPQRHMPTGSDDPEWLDSDNGPITREITADGTLVMSQGDTVWVTPGYDLDCAWAYERLRQTLQDVQQAVEQHTDRQAVGQ